MRETRQEPTGAEAMNRTKIKTFLLGSVFGGLVSLLLAPRGRRPVQGGPGRLLEKQHAFSSAPCYVPDDTFT
ncbi:MAG: hypothetical protein Kow00129_10160 [Thermoleophilia bacterium]